MEDIRSIFAGNPWPIPQHGAIFYRPDCGIGTTGDVCPDDMDRQDTAIILKLEKIGPLNGRLKLDPMVIGCVPETERGVEPSCPHSQCITEGVANSNSFYVHLIPLLNPKFQQDINIIQRLCKIEVQSAKGKIPVSELISPFCAPRKRDVCKSIEFKGMATLAAQ